MEHQVVTELSDIESEFSERMGFVLQREGMPRIAGKIWGILILREGAFSFSQLASLLRVSRASISTNTRLLEDLSVIERVGLPGHREDYFRLRKRPYEALMKAMQSRMSDAMTMCDDSLDAFSNAKHTTESQGAVSRIKQLKCFYQQLHHMADQISVEEDKE